MPFRSQAQWKRCYALQNRGVKGWDCAEWGKGQSYSKLPARVSHRSRRSRKTRGKRSSRITRKSRKSASSRISPKKKSRRSRRSPRKRS